MTPPQKKVKSAFEKKKIENLMKCEHMFIKNLYSILSLPTTSNNANSQLSDNKRTVKKPTFNSKTTRAKSLVELQTRIVKLKNKYAINYKEKLQKKNLKNRLKKKLKKETRNKQPKTKPANPPVVRLKNGLHTGGDTEIKGAAKPGKMVFSKVDFEGLGKRPKRKKVEKNPRKLLEQVQQVNMKMEQLKMLGEVDQATEMREKTAWKNALARAQGAKVKDDPVLLKRTIKKVEQKKRSSQKKWESRIEGVQKAKDERQKKRTENIEKRKKEKRIGVLKKAAKKGKIIPGF